MIISCDECGTTFELDRKYVKPGGTKVRCARCKSVFRVYPEGDGETGPKPAPPSPTATPPDPPTAPAAASSAAESDFDSPTLRRTPTPPMNKTRSESAPSPTAVPPATSAPRPETGADADEKAKAERSGSQRYVSFRKRLMYFAGVIIGFIALVVVPIELHRPYEELDRLIQNARSLIAGVRSGIPGDEMIRMNRFALETIADPQIGAVEGRENYFYLSFNLLITDGEIPPAADVFQRMEDFGAFGGRENFRYEWLRETADYWEARFAAAPGMREVFAKNKRLLAEAVDRAAQAEFRLSGVMIMLDSGKPEGFFADHIAFVLDSFEWYESAFSGEPYRITDENRFWRADALQGRVRYNNNPIADPQSWYLPRFDEDAFGAWFSVWLTEDVGDVYNIFNIDLDAGRVKRMLLVVLGISVGLILALIGLSLLIANRFSKSVTKPIRELTRGAEAVSAGNYDYQVPVIHEDEIGHFTRRFNEMIRGQKQRLNLMETMERFLSRELAEKAAENGLVLGGQKADCTVMFTDFAGFSTITQRMSATEAVNALNSYYDGLIPIIKKYGGFPDKYIGDAIVAMFGAPVRLENHADRAVACAIEMQWKMREINHFRKREGKTVFEMRIGLNSGEVIVGAIGCDQKLEYTSIGETTNLANRMESICEIGHVMIAEGTYEQIKNAFFKGVHISRDPEKIAVKGYPEPVSAYKVFVDNREIKKNPESSDLRRFYRYQDVDHQLRYSPQEIPEIEFHRRAEFIR
ncbi:MAG: adenylate/guanylate cyclase domain-containing protein [Desulfococcaceae bacterium]